MSRIDRTRVVGKDEEELDELTCGICLQIFEVPVFTKCCRKTFCKFCINEWLADNNTCPNDRIKLTVRQLLPAPRIVTNLLNKLKIKCENYGTHCQSVLTIEEMANHLKKCNFCDSCKTSQKLLSDNKKTIETLESENEKLKKALGQSKEESSGNKSKLNRLESEVGTLKKDLGQSKGELSVKQMTIETLKSVNKKLNTDLDQSNNELNKLKTFCLKFKQTEEEAIINARNISTPITRNVCDKFSKDEVTYLTNLAKSALSQKSFLNISEFIHDQIELKPDFKQKGWVIITYFKDSFTHYSLCYKYLNLTFNDIDIVFIGFDLNGN